MRADPLEIGPIFTNRIRYCVPIFQRHYVWDQYAQWEPLWDDILAKGQGRLQGSEKRYAHYLGAIVLESKGGYSTKKVQVCNVIDGQQRLTTLQIILAVLRDIAIERDWQEIAEDTNQYIFNANPNLMDAPDIEIFKVWPTRFDQETFSQLMSLRSRQEIRKKFHEYFPRGMSRLKKRGYLPLLLKAYIFFYDKIVEFIDDEGEIGISASSEDRLDNIYRACLEDFKLVEIQLDEKDDPQVIFETLNARGTPLLASDLIRNYIFYRAEDECGDPVPLYETYWSSLEDDFWSGQANQGRMLRARLEFFMHHFLAAKTGLEINLKKLFQEYKSFIQLRAPYPTIEAELQDIVQYGPIYRELVEPADDRYLSSFARRLELWDLTTIYPVVLQIVVSDEIDEREKREALSDLISYITRRGICQKTPKNYNKLFLQLVRHLLKVGVSRRAIQQFLIAQKGDSGLWPSDEEFEAAWLSNPIYQMFPSRRVQLILKEIENELHTNRSEEVEIKSWLTIEHVLPQSWPKHWPLQSGEQVTSMMEYEASLRSFEDPDTVYGRINRRKELIHTIGNLTLLTSGLNSSVTNGPFDQKRDAILENSALALNRYYHHIVEWDEDAIINRGKKLFEIALKIWPYPNNVK